MKDNIRYIENDQVGETTLNVIAEANKFNDWMYNEIKPFCKGKILEIGSGIGNISNYFLNDEFELMLSDIRQAYCSKLEFQFKENPNFLGVETLNLTDTNFDSKYNTHIDVYSLVYDKFSLDRMVQDHFEVIDYN